MHTVFDQRYYQKRIVVKFSEKQKIRPLQNFLLRQANTVNLEENHELEDINSLLISLNAQPNRLFERPELTLDQERIRAEKKANLELEDLNAYLQINVYKLQNYEIENLIDRLNRSPLVEIAYPMGLLSEPILGQKASDTAPPTALLSSGQGYLGPAPTGLNVLWAKSTPPYSSNSKGLGIKLTDIETGWDLTHEDLEFGIHTASPVIYSSNPVLNASGPPTSSYPWGFPESHHGTAVLGELIGAENNYGITGISPHIEISLYHIDERDGTVDYFFDNLANAISFISTNVLTSGDILLIEKHALVPGVNNNGACGIPPFVPVEYDPAVRSAILNATLNDIIVVEPAGNGGLNIDNVTDNGSGAIVVGAGTSTFPHNPLCFSNYGNRVDLQGWGRNIVTSGKSGDNIEPNGHDLYTGDFGGTSGASPMVAGAAAILNGYFKAADNGRVLTANAMRQLLKNTGTPQGTQNDADIPLTDPLHHIGELPDLKKAFEAGLPTADIKINGSDGPLTLSLSTKLHATTNFQAKGLAGLEADWWIILSVYNSLYYINSSMQWTTVPTPFFQGALSDQPTSTLFNLYFGTPTAYTLYFGIDTNMNGVLEFDHTTFYDNITFQVN